MRKFDLRAFKRELRVSAVSLGSLAPEYVRQARRSWLELEENDRAQSLSLRQFYNGLKEKINLGQIAWKQACTNLI